MMRTPVTRAALAATALALGAALTACSSAVAQSEVEESITTQLTAADGSHPESASCPDDLEAEVDATMTCDVSDVDGDFKVKVTVTSVDGDEVEYDIEPL